MLAVTETRGRRASGGLTSESYARTCCVSVACEGRVKCVQSTLVNSASFILLLPRLAPVERPAHCASTELFSVSKTVPVSPPYFATISTGGACKLLS